MKTVRKLSLLTPIFLIQESCCNSELIAWLSVGFPFYDMLSIKHQKPYFKKEQSFIDENKQYINKTHSYSPLYSQMAL